MRWSGPKIERGAYVDRERRAAGPASSPSDYNVSGSARRAGRRLTVYGHRRVGAGHCTVCSRAVCIVVGGRGRLESARPLRIERL